MLYSIKHDTVFKPPGRGRTADLSRPAFQEIFCAICRSFHVPETRAVLQRVRPGGRETGGVGYRVLRIATASVRTGFAMTSFLYEVRCVDGGGVRAPRPTERIQEVR